MTRAVERRPDIERVLVLAYDGLIEPSLTALEEALGKKPSENDLLLADRFRHRQINRMVRGLGPASGNNSNQHR